MRRWLVDTGAFVAYLDRTDRAHRAVADRVDAFSGAWYTTEAVVTETMYFLSEVKDGPMAFGELLVAAGVSVLESSQPTEILAYAALMTKYADTPMDYADATLVAGAERLGILDVLTLDRRGFSTYRTAKGKAFRLVLDR